MKIFLLKTLLFFIPALLISITEAFILPPDFFTFRSWEALAFINVSPLLAPATFYPGYRLRKKEVGDLAHHTNKEIIKNTEWMIDQRGYRNDFFIADPDILLIGDSFFVGSGLTQKETITNKLSDKLKEKAKVYNMAGGTFKAFDILLRNRIIKKPKLIIYGSVERKIKYSPYEKQGKWVKKFQNLKSKIPSWFNTLLVSADRMIRFYSIQWAKSRLNNQTGHGVVSPIDPRMLFFEGKSQSIRTEEDLSKTLSELLSYKKYCDSMGINFLYIPMPDKETVYYELVPLDVQPDFLVKLDRLLTKNGVAIINTLDLYNKERQKSPALLYLYDDTHWNSNATELVANEIIKNEQLFTINSR